MGVTNRLIGWRLTFLATTAFLLAACTSQPLATTAAGNDRSSASTPGESESIAVEESAPYQLYTHCGVLEASINGQTFYAEPPLSDGSGNPPAGWGNPFDDGDMTLQSATTADFRDSAGHAAHFPSTPEGPAPTIPICS